MTHMFKKQSTSSMLTTTTTSNALGMHRDSRVITKVQPKIRIIHIFAPEIIKTDVANFRELVQRLTGKPDAGGKGKGKGKGKEKGKANKVKVLEDEAVANGCNVSTKLGVKVGSGSSSSPSSSSSDHQAHDHHDHVGCWRPTAGDHISSSGGYLTGFTDLDYSFDFNTMFHLGAADGSSHLNSLGENTQLSFRG